MRIRLRLPVLFGLRLRISAVPVDKALTGSASNVVSRGCGPRSLLFALDQSPLGTRPTGLLAWSQGGPAMKDWAAFALTVSATLLIGHFLFGH